jgi:hypothetical protein
MEEIKILFEKNITYAVGRYNPNTCKTLVLFIVKQLTHIYENKELFKFILKDMYVHSRNPFISAYSYFMNLIERENIEDVFLNLAYSMLIRKYEETKSKNEYITFRNQLDN